MRSFIPGFVAGVVTLYASMCFHLVLASDGYHVVHKTALTFTDTYVDIRQFNAATWTQHVPLATAMIGAQKHELIKNDGQSAVRNAFDNLWNKQQR